MHSLPSLPSPTYNTLCSPTNTSYPTHIHSSNLEQPEKIKFTPDYEAGKPLFLRVFKELAKDNNGLVRYDKLHERLVSTGKYFVGDAVLMIEHMEKIGEIEQTEQHHVYRRRGGNLGSPD